LRFNVLDTLSGYEPSEALGVLSSLTFQLSPEPALEGETSKGKVNFASEDVVAEIRGRVGLAPDDYSDEARDKILSFISDQISEIVLSRTDEETVLNRLGDRGVLRPNLYEIIFPSPFKRFSERGIRQEHVRQALNYPDDVEHVLPEDMPFKGDGSFSLYVKHRHSPNPIDDFSLLVVSSRKGYQQRVDDAFRVYPSDVDVGSAKFPVDLLKALAEKYGLPLDVGNQRGKFFFLVVIDKVPEGGETFVIGAPLPSDSNIPYEARFMLRETEKTIEVSMAYALDEVAYRSDLKKHGVQVVL
jgi:hypothetical protein